MFSNKTPFLLSLFVILLSAKVICAQRIVPDATTHAKWPSISSSLIAPNGKYVLYTVRNYPEKFNTIVVKSLSKKWETRVVARNFGNDAYLGNDIAVFLLGKDSLCVVSLLQGVSYISDVSSFKVSNFGGNSIIAAKGKDKLKIIGKIKQLDFDGVLDYKFVLDGHQLLLQRTINHGDRLGTLLQVFDLRTQQTKDIWKGKIVEDLTVSRARHKIAFITQDEEVDVGRKFVVIHDLLKNTSDSVYSAIYPTLKLSKIRFFSQSDSSVILTLSEKIDKKDKVNPKLKLRVWNFDDSEVVSERASRRQEKDYLAIISISGKRLIRLQMEKDEINTNFSEDNVPKSILVAATLGDCTLRESQWNPACKRYWTIVDLETGNRTSVPAFNNNHPYNQYYLSPNNQGILYKDFLTREFFYYSVYDQKLSKVPTSIFSKDASFLNVIGGYYRTSDRGFAGWSADGNTALIYNDRDIFEVHLKSMQTLCLTNHFGYKENLVFSLIEEGPVDLRRGYLNIMAFDLNSKQNGFYKMRLDLISNPIKLSMGDFIYYLPHEAVFNFNGMRPVKATGADVFLVQRESVSSFPNLYYTQDFITFNPISDIHPENDYKWMRTELHTYMTDGGRNFQGVIYLPSDFDSTKKYPIIFNVYEKFSNSLNAYLNPDPLCMGCDINPLLFVNEGYVVFRPDIYFKPNETGECSVMAITAAIEYLSRFSWIDTSRMGLSGCSFGGFETNYIITHTNAFKAACAASSLTNLMSYPADKADFVYTALNFNQFRVNKMVWDDINPVVSNSPIVNAIYTTTPLLLFHTTEDWALDFNQAVQFYLALRTLRKRVWLLEYGQANHSLTDPDQILDFSTKLLEFFNFYLKNKSVPVWMISDNKIPKA